MNKKTPQRKKKGTGTVVHKKGLWYARWRIAGRDVYGEGRQEYDDGDRDRIEKHPEKTSQKPLKRKEVPSFAQWVFDQLEGPYGQALAPSTRNTNETIRTQWIEGHPIGKLKIDRLTRSQVVEWIGSLSGSPSTIRRVVAVASKMMSLAVDQGFRLDNPFARLAAYLPRVSERENRILSEKEARVITALKPEKLIDAVILFALYTGLRRGEICRIQWGNLKGAMLHIPKTKTHRPRTVPLSPESLEILEAQPKRGITIFTYEGGRPMDPHSVSTAYRRRREELGIPAGARLQDMRGTFSTMMLEQGTDLRAVMELTGHSKPETLLKSYARSNAGRKTGAVIKLSKRIGGRNRGNERTG